MIDTQKFGYNEDRTEYNSPYYVSIFHEDLPINWVLAACALRSQSYLLPENFDENEVIDEFRYHSVVAIVASQRFSADMFRKLSQRGFQEIYLVSKDNLVEYNRNYYSSLNVIKSCLESDKQEEVKGEEVKGEEVKGEEVKGEEVKGEEVKGEEVKGENRKETPINFKCVSYEEILDYVKLMGNAYPIYDDYLAIYGDSPNKAKIAMRLKFIERGLTADGTHIKDALASICNKLNYHVLIDIVLAKGRAYFDIAEFEANKSLEECRVLTTGDKRYALLHSTKLNYDALMNLAPLYDKVAATSAIIYATYDFPNNHWKLRCVSNGGSAFDCLKECYGGEVIGSFSESHGETLCL
jgi:hypothetical protein